MIVNRTKTEIYYPDSDGKPMAESDLHSDWMFRIIHMLQNHYRGRKVYATGNLMVYYEEGNPKKSVSPDAMVVLNCEPRRRLTFKTWEEGTPTVAFEVTSKTTKQKDLKVKPGIFAKLGILEYFLYDPTQDYLFPQLQGFRMEGGTYVPITVDEDGSLISLQLNLALRLEHSELILIDRASGKQLQTDAEEQQAHAERAQAEANRARAEANRERAGKEREREEKVHERAEKERARAEAERERAGKEREREDKVHERAEKERAQAEAERAQAALEHEQAERKKAEAEIERLRKLLDARS